MSTEIKIHETQVHILRELLFMPQANYAALQKPTGLSSDHFQFHINKLMELNLVEKISRGQYRLTIKGKEYANKLDTDSNTIERQPKMSVVLMVENTQGQMLAQQRLKQPYFGFWGRPTGKIRWGETFAQAAERELSEETGLSATWEIMGLYHKMDYLKDTDTILEDKVFVLAYGTNPRGTLIEQFEGGRNQWMNDSELTRQEHVFESIVELSAVVRKKHPSIIELRYDYVADEY